MPMNRASSISDLLARLLMLQRLLLLLLDSYEEVQGTGLLAYDAEDDDDGVVVVDGLKYRPYHCCSSGYLDCVERLRRPTQLNPYLVHLHF